jgi:hypothetical protein
MAEGIIQPGDFQIGVPVVVGAQNGAGVFEGNFDISAIIADIDENDIIVFRGFKTISDGGNLKQFANEEVTGADLQAQIDQGVEIDDLILLPPTKVAEGYATECSVTWVSGTPKAVAWNYS